MPREKVKSKERVRGDWALNKSQIWEENGGRGSSVREDKDKSGLGGVKMTFFLVDEVLLKLTHTHSFTHCVLLLSGYRQLSH